MSRPHAKAVLVTGASTGIGALCAETLNASGYRVFSGVRQPKDAERIQAESGGTITPVILDVTEPASIAQACEVLAGQLGGAGLDGLVNNAGVAIGGPLEFLPLDRLREQLEVNVIGQVAVTQAFLPLLRQARGRIINISSISGRCSMPFAGPYAASKFAVEALSDALRVELQPWGVDVVRIERGAFKTPIWEKSLGHAERMASELPPEAVALYGQYYERVQQYLTALAEKSMPPDKVAEAVKAALTARVPKTRYVVGRDARLRLLLSCLPDRVQDWLIRKALMSGTGVPQQARSRETPEAAMAGRG